MKKWSQTTIRGFWRSGANLSCDLSIYGPVPISQSYPKTSPNRAKSNYSFHWKLKGDRALILNYLDSQLAVFYFGELQGVMWGQRWTKNWQFVYISCLCKNLSFPKCLKQYLYNYKDYLWSEFQLNLMLLVGVIAPKHTKIGKIRS